LSETQYSCLLHFVAKEKFCDNPRLSAQIRAGLSLSLIALLKFYNPNNLLSLKILDLLVGIVHEALKSGSPQGINGEQLL